MRVRRLERVCSFYLIVCLELIRCITKKGVFPKQSHHCKEAFPNLVLQNSASLKSRSTYTDAVISSKLNLKVLSHDHHS
jgi:hypothetical protein